MKHARLLVVLALALAAPACMQSRTPELELLTGELTTPSGSYPVVEAIDGADPDAVNWHYEVSAQAPETRVKFRVVSESSVFVTLLSGMPEQLVPGRALYQLNDDAEQTLSVSARTTTSVGGAPGPVLLDLDLPAPLSRIEARAGHGMTEDDKRLIDGTSGDRHRLRFEWQVAEMPYSVDLTFRLDTEKAWYWGVPGTP